jgi:hypothetical protein
MPVLMDQWTGHIPCTERLDAVDLKKTWCGGVVLSNKLREEESEMCGEKRVVVVADGEVEV